MHEVVIVLSDLYLPQAPEGDLPPGITLSGLEHVARFGARTSVIGGWREWLAMWRDARGGKRVAFFGVSAVHAAEPSATAVVAAAQSLSPAVVATAQSLSPAVVAAVASRAPASAVDRATVWIASPVHLTAGLTSVHFDRRSVLSLPAGERAELTADFQKIFHDSGFVLESLESGDFLLFGPEMPIAATTEPARAMGENVADSLPSGAGAPALRRLGAEMEMWLHDHPVNDARLNRGEAPVTALWMWGGGTAAARSIPSAEYAAAEPLSDIAFGSDAYLNGLWALGGGQVLPLPQQLADLFGYLPADRAVLVVQIGSMLNSNPSWTLFSAVAHVDRVFVAPAVASLARGDLLRLRVIANDVELTLRPRDRFKLWRRRRRGLSGLL